MVSVYIGLQKLEQSYSKLSYSRGTFSKRLSLTFVFKLNGPLEGNNSSYNSLELLKYYSCTQCSVSRDRGGVTFLLFELLVPDRHKSTSCGTVQWRSQTWASQGIARSSDFFAPPSAPRVIINTWAG